ncbi:MAG: radical SAM protein [Acidobacteriota bacterium]
MHVLLIHPDYELDPAAYGAADCWFCEPLALEYLAAGARLDGHEVRILDLRLHPGGLSRALAEFTPDVAGITGYSQHVPRMLEICKECKAVLPNCATVVGGHHATVMPEDFFRSEVDHIVIGEGILPLRRLLADLDMGVRERVPGVWSRDGDAFIDGGEAPHPALDSLPQPDRTTSASDRSYYYMGAMKPVALLRTSIGCTFRCSFCSLWRLMRGKYLVRSIDDVVREIEQIGEENIHVVDDEPWLDRRRMELLAGSIARAGIRKSYFAYCRVDTLIKHESLLSTWRGIGLRCLFLGIEAITPRELQQYKKGYTVAQVERALERAADLGLTPYCLFVIHPSYSRTEFDRLSRFIQRRRIPNPSFTVWTPLPGTYELADFQGLTELGVNGRPNWYYWDLQHPVVPTRLPKEEFMRQVLRMRMVHSNLLRR